MLSPHQASEHMVSQMNFRFILTAKHAAPYNKLNPLHISITMKNHLLTATLLFYTLLLYSSSALANALAQNHTPEVDNIRAKYQHIQTHLKDYRTASQDIWGESTEGGKATAHYDHSNVLQRIEVIWFGESGKRIVYYYFDHEQLVFALDQQIHYNRPIYWNQSLADEVGDTELFDPTKSTVIENRYYFKHEQPILWLDNTGQTVDLNIEKNTEQAQAVIAHAKKMYQQFLTP
ncbi:hypothetical protein SAMN05421749_10627 [Acinetobacter marinus]|uniref:Uncharacterized protein n=2 Tax=Acinetobacter marinus TaxID=281375 RepID=A0A1G6M1T1_9GAMM|nr:hypothetical protein SAMN05421749_10627 [Acinetobacter marinus]